MDVLPMHVCTYIATYLQHIIIRKLKHNICIDNIIERNKLKKKKKINEKEKVMEREEERCPS